MKTELALAEFEDDTGATRRLTRDECLLYINMLAGAGNETTTRLIGWTGKVLAEYPDQRRRRAAAGRRTAVLGRRTPLVAAPGFPEPAPAAALFHGPATVANCCRLLQYIA